jgi:hypothetical protein
LQLSLRHAWQRLQASSSENQAARGLLLLLRLLLPGLLGGRHMRFGCCTRRSLLLVSWPLAARAGGCLLAWGCRCSLLRLLRLLLHLAVLPLAEGICLHRGKLSCRLQAQRLL